MSGWRPGCHADELYLSHLVLSLLVSQVQLRKLNCPQRAYLLLLRSYKQNSAHTNHCVVKMLHRLAHDLKMEALLFQLSLFYLFNRLLSDPAAGAYKVRKHQRRGLEA